jgi:hypothetical protein
MWKETESLVRGFRSFVEAMAFKLYSKTAVAVTGVSQ